MSCQPSQLTGFRSQSSDSDESVDSDTMEQSEPRLSEVCDICHFLATREWDPGLYPPLPSFQKFSRVRSSALAGRQCCRIIVDAIETWLQHAKHKAHKAVHQGSGLLFDALEVSIEVADSIEIYRTHRYTLRPLVELRWQGDNADLTGDGAENLRLMIFAPHGMQKRATGSQFSHVLTSRH